MSESQPVYILTETGEGLLAESGIGLITEKLFSSIPIVPDEPYVIYRSIGGAAADGGVGEGTTTPDVVMWKTYDWRQMISAADPKPSFYDEYRFSGRTFKKRNTSNYDTSEVDVAAPSYKTLDD